jgi:mannitol-1-/sugar-/sorbitol-6-phosphatase
MKRQHLELSAKGLLFDSDGTLLDAFESANRVWDKWATRVGAETPVLRSETHGLQRPMIIKMLLPGISDDDANRYAEEIRQAELHDTTGVVALPGTFELLSSLPSDAWAVVTSADREVAEARLVAAGLPIPKVMVSADELEHGKPNPSGYLLGCERLHIQPDEAIVFEDAPAGLEAARRAGIRAIAGRHTSDNDAQLQNSLAIVDNLSQVSVNVTAGGLTVFVDNELTVNVSS